MTRRGISLIEMMAAVTMLTLVLDIGVTTTAWLERAVRDDAQPGLVVDLACDALRRDLARGARIEGADLLAGSARWRIDGGVLERNGVPRLRLAAGRWTLEGGAVVVRLSPKGLPSREVRSWQ